MRLQELQRAFQARVLLHEEGIEAELNHDDDIDCEPRLDTYVEGYRTRLVEALGATYPVLRKTLGSEEFARQMRDYIDTTRSMHYSVREYGADIAQWLKSHSDSGQAKELAELARWEWTLADVFDAHDDQSLEISALATVPPAAWPGLSFTMRACVRRFETQSNIVQWWRAANGLCDQPAKLIDGETSQWILGAAGLRPSSDHWIRLRRLFWTQLAEGPRLENFASGSRPTFLIPKWHCAPPRCFVAG